MLNLSSLVKQIVIFLALIWHGCIYASSTVEVFGEFGVGKFIDGVNLTGNKPYSSAMAEWSADKGQFAAVGCFLRGNNQEVAVQRGCDLQIGWFVPINEQRALTFSVSRHDYSSPKLSGWQYTDAQIRLHLGKSYSVGLRGSDSLLGRGYSSTTAFFETSRALTNRLSLNLEAAHTKLESNPRANNLSYALLGLDFHFERLSVGAKLLLADSNYQRFVKLEFEQPAFGVNLRYRFY